VEEESEVEECKEMMRFEEDFIFGATHDIRGSTIDEEHRNSAEQQQRNESNRKQGVTDGLQVL
jgi:hypothetical protein